MILPDVNLLIYAHNESSKFHTIAHPWWEHILNSTHRVLLPHFCINSFVRITTQTNILTKPLHIEEALEIVDQWLSAHHLFLISPAGKHYSVYRGLLLHTGVGGKLTNDAYLAALAIENNATLCSNDSDFGRFKGLRWNNPLNRL